MTTNMVDTDETGARALLDLRYGGNDATIRCTTPVKYPTAEDIMLKQALNGFTSTLDKAWTKFVNDSERPGDTTFSGESCQKTYPRESKNVPRKVVTDHDNHRDNHRDNHDNHRDNRDNGVLSQDESKEEAGTMMYTPVRAVLAHGTKVEMQTKAADTSQTTLQEQLKVARDTANEQFKSLVAEREAMRVKLETAMRERDAANEQFQSLVAEKEAMRVKLETAIKEGTAMKKEHPVDNHCVRKNNFDDKENRGVVNQAIADGRKNAVTNQTLLRRECRCPRQATMRERAPPVRVKDVRQVAEKPPVAAEVTIRTEGEMTAGDEKQQADPPLTGMQPWTSGREERRAE
jgi:hypothetical protein